MWLVVLLSSLIVAACDLVDVYAERGNFPQLLKVRCGFRPFENLVGRRTSLEEDSSYEPENHELVETEQGLLQTHALKLGNNVVNWQLKKDKIIR